MCGCAELLPVPGTTLTRRTYSRFSRDADQQGSAEETMDILLNNRE
jgi:hypothetical protein